MKKSITIISLLFFATFCHAQNNNVYYGTIPVIASSTSLDSFAMSPGVNLLTHVVHIRKKSYTNLAYSWGSNSLVLVTGFFTKRNTEGRPIHDIYIPLTKSLSQPGGYAGLGYEISKDNFYIFVEVGTNWHTWKLSDSSFTVGVMRPIAWQWK
jgi:hypothetical protein